MQSINISDRTNILLPTLSAERGSVLECEIRGIAKHLDHVQVHIGRKDTSALFPVNAVREPGGIWRVYVPGLVFPDVGKVQYQISALDDKRGSHWLGGGYICISPSVINVDEPPSALIPEDTYIRNPATGLWHKLSVTFEDGEMVSQLEQEGITR